MRVEGRLQRRRVGSFEAHAREEHVLAVGVLEVGDGRIEEAHHPGVVHEWRGRAIELGLARARVLAPPAVPVGLVLREDRGPHQLGDGEDAALHLRLSRRAGGDDARGQERVPGDRP